MLRLIGATTIRVVLVLALVSAALAFMLDLAPGDPAFALLGDQASPEQVAQVHAELGLNDPVLERYARWVGGLLQGDFGESFRTQRPVLEQIWERLPVTLEIAVLALLIALVVSIPIGVYTAHRSNGVLDRSWSVASSFLVGIPPFVMALVLVSLFSLQKQSPIQLPATGWTPLTEDILDNLRHAILPALTLALALIPQYSRQLRSEMVGTLSSDFILAAQAKGASTNRILWRHALRPSSISLITLAGTSLGQLLGGSVIVEVLFALPGLGNLTISSINSKDVLVVQGVVMFVAIAYISINALIDIAYGMIDPRIRSRNS